MSHGVRTSVISEKGCTIKQFQCLCVLVVDPPPALVPDELPVVTGEDNRGGAGGVDTLTC